ncbi:MAG: cyclic nucleotide-binding domain-containing protein [Leptospiraceae bacterium]|nr:cyclic nucleotide-binding domain-containing protein [Leptospiraceae bacterium]
MLDGKVGVYRSDWQDGQHPLVEIGPGGSFGELGLLIGNKRTGTIKALADRTKVVSITEAVFKKEVAKNQKFLEGLIRLTIHRILELQKIVKVEGYQMNWELPDEILKAIQLNRMRNLSLGSNHTVFHSGSKNDNYIYVVAEGEVGIFLEDAHGTEQLAGSWQPGDIFGYMHLVHEPNRQYTARTLERNTLLIFLDKEMFHKLILIFPDFGFSLYSTILTHLVTYQYNMLRSQNQAEALV